MKHSVNIMRAAVIIALLAGGCGGAAGVAHHVQPAQPERPRSAPPNSPARSAVTAAAVPRCPARALVLQPGRYASPMTGEHAVMYALTNRGLGTCTLRGYPRVVLHDAAGTLLPFRYARGGGPYVTSAKPVTVVLARGASAYVLVAKYRCDLGVARSATSIRLTLAAAGGSAFVVREAVGTTGSAGLSYCRGGPHDPGQAIAVSPVEATPQATG